jgi:hypothetical protein
VNKNEIKSFLLVLVNGTLPASYWLADFSGGFLLVGGMTLFVTARAP